MKWLLISTIVIIFGVVYTSADDPLTEDCVFKEIDDAAVERHCFETIIQTTEFHSESQRVLFEYSGDNATVVEFQQKYCPIGMQLLECLRAPFEDVTTQCASTLKSIERFANYKILHIIRVFLCRDKGKNLLSMMPNNGFATIAHSSCLNYVLKMPALDENSWTENEFDTLYCALLDRGAECFATELQGNDNTKLPQSVKRVYKEFNRWFGCNI